MTLKQLNRAPCTPEADSVKIANKIYFSEKLFIQHKLIDLDTDFYWRFVKKSDWS